MGHEARLKAALADRYRIEREIGSGGMATVYLAEDLKHHRQVAVKVLDPELAQALGAERFLREIETAANLTHPHILPLHDSGEADGFLYFVMPYVEGESLRTRLSKEKQLPIEDAIQITREIADALAYAHEKGVIHRDVKPANIMLEEGHGVLADFGVAHAVAQARDERITRTGTSLGTPAYMSPEQATGEQELDGRSDQYALGCVLYEMLAGHPPFTGAQIEAVIRQHLTAEPPSITKSRPSVAEEIAAVLDRALSKSPADRFKTTGEMAAALALTTAPRKVEEKPGPNSLRIALGVAVLVVAGLLGRMVLRPSEESGSARVAVADGERPSIAVLPCTNMSPDPADAYLAAGLHDEILLRLQRISSLRVLGRTSVSQFADNPPEANVIASTLGVGFIGECSIRKALEQIRLTFQLLDGETGIQIWAENYDRTLSLPDLLNIQTDIATQVSGEIGIALSPSEESGLRARPTEDLDAYEYYLRGNAAYLLGRGMGSPLGGEVIGLIERATLLDPGFALAHARLALALTYGASSIEDRFERAKISAERALSLVPNLPEGLVALSRYHQYTGDMEEGVRLMLLAEQTEPYDAEVVTELARLQRRMGDYDVAIQTYLRAQRLDPGNPLDPRALMYSYMFAHRFDEALESNERWRALQTEPTTQLQTRAWIHLMRGDTDAFETSIREYYAVDPNGTVTASNGYGQRVLDRIATPDQRQTLYNAYVRRLMDSGGEAASCQRSVKFCIETALHEQALGRFDRAGPYWDSTRAALAEASDTWLTAVQRTQVLMGLGNHREAVQAAEHAAELARTGVEGVEGPDMFWTYPLARILLAQVHGHFKEYDRAIDILAEELPAPSWLTVHILEIDPIWDPLRSHPRFQTLLEEYREDVEH